MNRTAPDDMVRRVARRATGPFKLGAVLVDRQGRVFAWGWSHNGRGLNGRSVHAEEHAIRRANPSRLRGAVLHVARVGKRGLLLAKPCARCQQMLDSVGALVRYSISGGWPC